MPKSHNILLTRELSQDQLSLAESLGLSVVVEPAISISFRNDWVSVKSLIEKSENVVFAFTSQNGVKGFDRYRAAGVEFPGTTTFAVGGKTADALADIGIENPIVPEQEDGVGLAHKIVDHFLKTPELKNATVLHFCGDRRRDELRQFLTELEIEVKDIVVYKTELNQMDLKNGFKDHDAILFYSPSAVQAFRNSGGFASKGLPELFAIGNTTAEELSIESGKHVHVSPEANTEDFLKFVSEVLTKNSDSAGGRKKVPSREGI